jgi:2',3'-cyclic-nucleotide 2'-phosphodiesterase (5'-nucleotidase family)
MLRDTIEPPFHGSIFGWLLTCYICVRHFRLVDERNSESKSIMNKFVPAIAARLSWILLLLVAAFWCAQAQAPKPAPQPPDNIHARATEVLVDSSIGDDPAVDKMLAAYSPKVRELDAVIGTLKGELRKGGTGAGSMGNFVADGMRAQGSLKLGQPIDLAIMNSSGLRRNTISEGELRKRDIFELLPFENALVTLELTGEQVTRLLGVVISSREAQSGARIVYFTKADKTSEVESAKLRAANGREVDIDPKATYRVVTIDYLINVGGERYAILREGKNIKPLGITLREAIIAYVKAETAAGQDIKPNLDGRFYFDRAKSAATEEVRPQ